MPDAGNNARQVVTPHCPIRLLLCPHTRSAKPEALRRLQPGLTAMAGNTPMFTVEQESWNGNELAFRVRALGQSASGSLGWGERRAHCARAAVASAADRRRAGDGHPRAREGAAGGQDAPGVTVHLPPVAPQQSPSLQQVLARLRRRNVRRQFWPRKQTNHCRTSNDC
jgi:hypothetical protein